MKLYCGYAYESELISESFGTAITAAAAFAIGVILLIAFVRTQDYGLACLALVAFLWMLSQLTGASFFYKYYGTHQNSLLGTVRLINYGALLVFLALRGGKYRSILWGIISAYALSVAAYAAMLLIFPTADADNSVFSISMALPDWFAFAGLVAVLVLGAVFWRGDSWFYRIFTPVVLAGVAVTWAAIVFYFEKDMAVSQLAVMLPNGDFTYVCYRTMPAVMAAALSVAIAEALKTELSHRIEKRLLEERRELTLASYENMRCQHEEVMMLRHDMFSHFEALKELTSDEQVIGYLDTLIGQNKNIRPVVQTGNEMLDVILNGRLSAAMDAGISVEIVRSIAPEKLTLSDADLCSLVMNIMNNAVTAAAGSGAAEPFIRLDVHMRDSWFAIVCENSADISQIKRDRKKETVPKHGLGLKIIEGTAERYGGLVDTEYGTDFYKIQVILPLN